MTRRRHLHSIDGGEGGDVDETKRSRGRPSKSLQQHVDDGSFERRKHEELLAGDELVAEPELRKLQQRFRRLKTDEKRKEVALAFERAARESAPERTNAAAAEFQQRVRKLGRPGSAQRAINFFEEFYSFDDGSDDGAPFVLDPAQREIIKEIHRRDRQRRRVYQEILLGMCRGQGKTPLASGLGTQTIATAPRRVRVYQIAGSKEQAKIGTEYSSDWVENGDLKQVLRAQKGKVLRRDGRGLYEVLSSDGRLAHGKRGWLVGIADELWLFRSYGEEQSYIALESALHKDPESYLVGISTAGYSKRSLLGRKYKRGLACPQVETRREGFLTIGRDPDAGFLMWWYGMPEGYDLDLENDSAVMRALKLANPMSWTNHRAMLRSLRRAMNGDVDDNDDIGDVLEWLRLCLNFWTIARGLWLKPGAWAALADKSIAIPKHSDVYVGVDAAHSYDTTAVSWSWVAPDGRVVTRCHVFSVRASAPAHEYVDDFYGPDGVHVAERFINDKLAGDYCLRVREVVADPNYFGAEIARLGKRFLTAPIFPSSMDMREYVQRFYRDVHSRQIVHDGDQVLAEHVDAIAGEKTKDGYWSIGRLKQAEAMDGGTSSIISNGRARAGGGSAKPWADKW